MWQVRFQALELAVELCADDSLARPLRQLTGTFGPARGEPARRWALAAGPEPSLSRDGRTLCIVEDADDLVPIFEFDLYAQALASARGLPLHAAALLGPEGALLLCGPSGSGKSTLALALLEQGAGYLSDELCAIDAEARVRGFTRPLAFDLSSSAAPRLPPGFASSSRTLRGRHDEMRSALLIEPPAAQLFHGAAPVSALVFLAHAPSAEPALSRLSAGEALTRLWAGALEGSRELLPLGVELVSRCPAHALSSRTVEEACSLLGAVCTFG